jgi:hypothetical protein
MPAKPFVFGTFYTSVALPSSLSDLAIWNRYNTGHFQDSGLTTPATGTDPVGGWSDQSGNSNHMTQGTAGDRPVLASNAVDFVSSDFLTAASALTLKPATFFCLINFDTLSGAKRLLGGGGSTLSVHHNNASLILAKHDVLDIATSSVTLTTGAYTRIIISYDASGNYAFTVNGATEGTGTNDTAISSGAPILGGPAVFVDGQIKDWGLYTAAKTGADITVIDNYLASL